MGCRISTVLRIVAVDAAPKKFVKLVKLDGKVLEFRAPILVKDALLNFSAGSADVALSKHIASEHLPSNYELKLGKVYYILPRFCDVSESIVTDSATARRIKIIITKQQLHEIMTNQISLQKLLSDISASGSKTIPYNTVNHLKNWKPKLQVIHEEVQQRM